MDAKYLRRFGDGGVVMSRKRVSNILSEFGENLSCGTQVLTIPGRNRQWKNLTIIIIVNKLGIPVGKI